MAGILAFSDDLFGGFNSKYVSPRNLFPHVQNDISRDDYHLLVPGEYIAIVAGGFVGRGDDMHYANGIFIIAKVVSVKKKNIFNGCGSAVLEFHDGTTGKISGASRDSLFKFFPNGYQFNKFQVYSFNDRTHLMKCMEMRPKIIEEQKRREEEIRHEEESRKRQEEEAARIRNAAVSDDDLSRAFRGETAAPKFDFLKCPKCGTNLRVPLGKGQIEVKCPKCGFTFITRT